MQSMIIAKTIHRLTPSDYRDSMDYNNSLEVSHDSAKCENMAQSDPFCRADHVHPPHSVFLQIQQKSHSDRHVQR